MREDSEGANCASCGGRDSELKQSQIDRVNKASTLLQRHLALPPRGWKERVLQLWSALCEQWSRRRQPYRRSSYGRKQRLLTLSVLAAMMIFLLWAESSRLGSSIIKIDKYWSNDKMTLSTSSSVHPVLQLADRAELEFQARNASQSKRFREVVAEYRRRNGRPPPPRFDRWYNFAIARNTQLIDEFDSIHSSLEVFWSLSPREIRSRASYLLEKRDSLSLMGVSITNHSISVLGSGQGDFQASATHAMISTFAEWLPDMDLVFNVNDEPRVIVPHEDVGILRNLASDGPAPEAWKNAFTELEDVVDSPNVEEETSFTQLSHQNTWQHVRLACPPNSPARSLKSNKTDVSTTFAFHGVDFAWNVNMHTDICLRPSARTKIGLLASPNALSLTYDLVPIFSPSKLSTFSDILYPSPYYYAGKARFDVPLEEEIPWHNKTSKLYWHGATSGGYSSNGLWRSLLRQSMLSKLTLPKENETFATLHKEKPPGPWTPASIPASVASERYDLLFTEIKQCTYRDCQDLTLHFGSHPLTPQSAAWNYKYLLDIDGNALSGRFPSSLASGAVVMKASFFREWRQDRILPWREYVPITENVNEVAEMLMFFKGKGCGKATRRKISTTRPSGSRGEISEGRHGSLYVQVAA